MCVCVYSRYILFYSILYILDIFYLNVLQRASITEEAWNNEADKMSQLADISYPQPNVGTQWAQEWRRQDTVAGRRPCGECPHQCWSHYWCSQTSCLPGTGASPRWHHPSKIRTDVDNLRPLSHWREQRFIFIETNTYSRHGCAPSAAVASVNPIWGRKEILIHWQGFT